MTRPHPMQPLVDWDAIDLVMLDMDGTILDLSFDNRFWRDLVPERYAHLRGIGLAHARAELEPKFVALQGTLEWYCLDHWGGITGLDLVAMKHESRAGIAPLPGALDFLAAVRSHGVPLWLATNAHPASLAVKMEQTGLAGSFDRLLSSHEFGYPKEDLRFWQHLAAKHPFDPVRTLFVDDSLPVLRAARDYGIGQLVSILRPDTTRPLREVTEFPAVGGLSEIAPSTVPNAVSIT